MQIDNYYYHYHQSNQQQQQISGRQQQQQLSTQQLSGQQLVTFTIHGKTIGNNCLIRGDRLIDIYNPDCNDITITGNMINVTDKSEIYMVSQAYLDSFINIMLYNDDINDNEDNEDDEEETNKLMNYKFDLNVIYKMNIHHITLTHTLTKQSVYIDVNDYYHVDNNDLIKYVDRYDIDDNIDIDDDDEEENEFKYIKEILEQEDGYEY